MQNILTIIQIIVSIGLIVVVLMQNKGAGLSGVFGGEGNVYRTKRGAELGLYYLTIALGVVFAGLSLVILFL